jgi:geranylgeranyl pyrophosphate synthase
VAGDVRKRKKTLPLVWALQHASEPDAARLREIYQPIRATDGSLSPGAEQPMTDAEVDEVLAILERSGAHEHAMNEALRYREMALRNVEALPVPEERRAELRLLVESVILI